MNNYSQSLSTNSHRKMFFSNKLYPGLSLFLAALFCLTSSTGLMANETALNLSVSVTAADVTCTGVSDGVLIATPDGGLPPYSYAWSNGATTATVSGLAPGTYTVTITDDVGATATNSGTINASAGFQISLVPTFETCTGSNDAKVDIVFDQAGVAPYTYLWSTGATGFQLTDVGAGTYSVTVTDSRGCEASASGLVELSPEGIWLMTSATDATCGSANGTVYVNAMTGVPPFTYIWSNGNTTANPGGLVAGTYYVTVTDANGCSNADSATVNLVGSNLQISLVASYETCTGSSDAKVDVVIDQAGVAPYTYLWSDGSTNFQLTDVGVGNYSVTVTDADGCSAMASIVVELSPEGIWLMTTTTDADCGQANGSAYVGAMTGVPPYTYLWSNGDTTANSTGLTAGTYTVTVSDSNGCTNEASATVNTSNPPEAGVIFTNDTLNFCVDDSVADIVNVTSTGNTGTNFIYVITDSNGNILNTTTNSQFNFEGTGAGVCRIYGLAFEGTVNGATVGQNISDITGCFDLAGPIEVTRTTCPTPCDANAGTLTAVSPECLPIGGTLVIQATANGDAVVPAGYATVYVLTSGAGLLIQQTSNTPSFTVDAAGAYTIHTLVYDPNTLDLNTIVLGTTTGFDINALLIQGGGNICAALDVTGAPIVVEDCPDPCVPPILRNVVVIKATCGNNDGKATLTVAGDPNAFEYTWDPNVSNTYEANNIGAGTYSVTISDPRDPAACNLVEVFTVGTVDGPEVEIVQTTPATCKEANGTATLSPVTYRYDWCNGATGFNVTNLEAGECQVTVTDPATGCVSVIEVVIGIVNPLTATAQINTNPDCGVANGSVTILPAGGSNNYSYAWSDGGSGATRTDLASGAYEVTVIDQGPTGCETIVPFVLTDNVPGADVEVEAVVFTTCPNENDATAVFTVTPSAGFSGTPVVTIEDAVGNVYTNGKLGPGIYFIVVRDGDGCLAGGATFEVKDPSQLDVDVAIINKSCLENGSILLDISGGTAPYTVEWADLSPASGPEDRINLVPGNYGFTVTDDNGCSVSVSGLIVRDDCTCDQPQIASLVVVEASCGNSDGSAVLNMVGDPSAYTYTWTPGISGDNTAFNIPAGIYSVIIRDRTDEDCAIEETFTIGHVDGPDASATTTDASCGQADGTATLTPATWTYEWQDGFVGDTRSDLAEGAYFVKVIDPALTDCPNFITVVISSANTIRASATVDSKPNCNSADGRVTLTASGGSNSYTYLWADGFDQAVRTGLASGVYQVTVTDQLNNGCSTVLTFALTDDVPGADVNVGAGSFSLSCIGGTDGTANFTTTYSLGFSQPADTTIVDAAGNEYTNGSLGEGTYVILIRDGNGCLAGAGQFNIVAPDQIDMDLAVYDGDCDSLGRIEVTDLRGGNGNYIFDWADLVNVGVEPRDRADLPAGSYTLNVSDSEGCDVSVTLMVEGPDELIEVDAIDDFMSCEPSALVQANSATAISYLWYNALGEVVGSGRDTAVDASSTTFYYVIATDAFGCTASDTVNITEGAVNIDLEGPALACEGLTTQLEVINRDTGDVLSYQWTPDSMIIVGASTATPIINTDSLGPAVYTVTVTNQFGCSVTESISVGVADTTMNPDAVISFTQCEPGVIDFEAQGLDTRYYLWDFGDMNVTTDTASGSSVSYTYPEAGTYLVTLSLPATAGCPNDSITKLVTVVEPPLASLAFDWEFESCADTAVINLTDQSIHQTGDIDSWQWIFNGTDTSNVQNPTYTLTQSQDLIVALQIVTEDGCIEDVLDTIDINLVEASFADLKACPGDTVNLNSDGNVDYTYVWSPANDLSDPTAVNPSTVAETTTEYTVVIADSTGECQITRTLELEVRSDLADFTANGDSTNTCDDGDVTISASGTGVSSYQWSDDPSFANIMGTDASLEVTPSEPGMSDTYYVEAADQFGCTAMDSVMVTNREVRFEFQQSVIPVCLGTDKEVVIIIDQAEDYDISVDWSPDAIIKDESDQLAPIINPTEDGYLVAMVSNQFGCSKVDSAEIDVINLDDDLTISVDPSTVCEQGEEIQLFINDDPTYTYNWSDDGTISDTQISNPTARPGTGVNPGNEDVVTYSVTVTDENGCQGNRSIDITVIIPDCGEPWIFFPNAFTPNEDGNNDRLRPRGFNIDQVYWVIYNRWGEKIYEANNTEQSWDGTFNGERLSPDVYGYYLRVTCTGGKTYTKKGNVTLLR